MGKSFDNSPKRPQENRNFIVKELGFNKTQLEQFRENSEGHHEIMMRLSDDVKNLKDNLFDRLSDNSINDATIDSISSLICEKEKQKEKEIFYHFKMIQDLSNDKQKEKFKTILKDALRQGGQGNRPPPPSKGKGHRPPPRNN
tara:strand:+ start:1679 stop:2107 length:429 start_codon:yes stop_codon:yes gene_type:complete